MVNTSYDMGFNNDNMVVEMTLESKDMLKLSKEELEELMFTKEGIPKCIHCGVPRVNAYDSILKAVSKYLWESNCEHSKDTILCIG